MYPEKSCIWSMNTDGAIRPERGISGLAAIVRNENNQICFWWKRRAGPMTCNEAEYAAVIFALERLIKSGFAEKIPELEIYCDSKILVDQMSGRAETHAPALRKSKANLEALVAQFKKISFRHIAREQNRLADALAYEAVEGKPKESSPKTTAPNLELWEQLNSSWRVP